MKNSLFILPLLFATSTVYCQKNNNEVLYKDIKYTYKVIRIDSQKYNVEIARTNISRPRQRLLVIDHSLDQDYDTLSWHHYLDFLEWNRSKIYSVRSPHYRGFFERDTLIDGFTQTEEAAKVDVIIRCGGPCYSTDILKPGVKNKFKFSIRTKEDKFYFYEKYWFAERSDKKETRIKKIPLSEGKYAVVCFPIILK